MPIQPHDRHQRDAGRPRSTSEAPGHFPIQGRYRGARIEHGGVEGWSWRELDELPEGASARRGLRTR